MPDDRRLAELEVNVAGAAVDGALLSRGDSRSMDRAHSSARRPSLERACTPACRSVTARARAISAQRGRARPRRLARMPHVAAEQARRRRRTRRASGPPRSRRRRCRSSALLGRPRGAGVVVERGGEGAGVAVEVAVEDRLGREPRGDERLVDAVAREGIDEPGRVADEQHAARRRGQRRAGASAAGGRGRRCSDGRPRRPCACGEPVEVIAQAGPFAPPAADAEIRVIALREHPAVAPGQERRARSRRSARSARGRAAAQPTLPSSATPRTISGVEAGCAGDDAVGAVGADEHVGAAPARRRPSPRPRRRRARSRPRARRRGTSAPAAAALLGEMRVEAPPLRHQDQRLVLLRRNCAAVAQPELERVDDVLDDGRDVTGRLPQRATREPAAARLVAREPRAVGEQHARPARARWIAVADPAGPAPTTRTSTCSTPRS